MRKGGHTGERRGKALGCQCGAGKVERGAGEAGKSPGIADVVNSWRLSPALGNERPLLLVPPLMCVWGLASQTSGMNWGQWPCQGGASSRSGGGSDHTADKVTARRGDTLLPLSLLLLCLFPTNCPCSSLQSLGESQGSTPLPGMQRARGQDIYAKDVRLWRRGGEG